MSRYNDTKKDNNKFGKRVYKTTMYPFIEKDNEDIYIRAKSGDRLDTLAHKYYRDTKLWWIIAQANHLGKGSLNIPPGTQLRIPTNLSVIMNDLEKLNK